MTDIAEFEGTLRSALSWLQPESPVNRLSVSALRSHGREYLASYEAEVKQFPHTRNDPHWNLIMADGDPGSEAAFFIILFTTTVFALLLGRGLPGTVRQFCEQEFSGAPETVLASAATRFPCLGPFTLPIGEALFWFEAA